MVSIRRGPQVDLCWCDQMISGAYTLGAVPHGFKDRLRPTTIAVCIRLDRRGRHSRGDKRVVVGVTSRFAQNCTLRLMHEPIAIRPSFEREFCNSNFQIKADMTNRPYTYVCERPHTQGAPQEWMQDCRD